MACRVVLAIVLSLLSLLRAAEELREAASCETRGDAACGTPKERVAKDQALLQLTGKAVFTKGPAGSEEASNESTALSKPRLPESSGTDAPWHEALIAIMWPRIDAYLQEDIRERITDEINKALPSKFPASIQILKLSIGDATPKFSKLRIRERADKAIVLDLSIEIRSNLDVQIKALKLPAGIQAFSFVGTLTVCLRPPVLQPPWFGGIEIYFITPPELDFDLTGVAGIADWKIIRGVIQDTIMKAIVRTLVLPARVVHDLRPDDEVKAMDLRYPEPLGVLRVLVESGRDLNDEDMGRSTSDPYVLVQVGQEQWTSSTVWSTTNPTWEQSHVADFLVYDERQQVRLQVFDKDRFGQDDFLGEATVLSAEHFRHPPTTSGSKFALTRGEEKVPAGELTLSTTWFSLASDAPKEDLSEVVAHGPSQMLLSARLEEASGFAANSRAPFTVRITVSTKDQVYTMTSGRSSRRSSVEKQEVVEQAGGSFEVSDELRKVVLNLEQRQTALEEISAITGLASEEVQMILNSTAQEDVQPQEEKGQDKAVATVSFGEIMRLLLPWTPEMRENAGLQIEVLDARQRRVGDQITRRMDTVALQGDRGPFVFSPTLSLKASLSVKWLQVPN